MDDPFFSELKQTLESIFPSEPWRNGKYIYPEVQRLREAIDNYRLDEKKTFFELVKAIGKTLPHLKKCSPSIESIQKAVNPWAKIHHMPPINWEKYLYEVSLFQFNGSNHAIQDMELVEWLTATSGENFPQDEFSVQVRMLIDHVEHLGFSQKLTLHLEEDPEFLSRLIMKSENNFITISNTRLILHLTDKQIAKAILRYLPSLLQEHQNLFEKVDQLMEKLNKILSNGRSVSTLLRNSDAKSILYCSEYFRIYQSEEYKNYLELSSFPPEDENLNP